MLIRLKELRTNKKLKQKELAELLDVTTATYNRYETGRLCPGIGKLILLADFYKVTMDYLLMRKEGK